MPSPSGSLNDIQSDGRGTEDAANDAGFQTFPVIHDAVKRPQHRLIRPGQQLLGLNPLHSSRLSVGGIGTFLCLLEFLNSLLVALRLNPVFCNRKLDRIDNVAVYPLAMR